MSALRPKADIETQSFCAAADTGARRSPGGGEQTLRNHQAFAARARRSIFNVFLYVIVLREASEHVAVLVGSDALRHWRAGIRRGDEAGHLAILDATDADALPERRVHLFI